MGEGAGLFTEWEIYEQFWLAEWSAKAGFKSQKECPGRVAGAVGGNVKSMHGTLLPWGCGQGLHSIGYRVLLRGSRGAIGCTGHPHRVLLFIYS